LGRPYPILVSNACCLLSSGHPSAERGLHVCRVAAVRAAQEALG